MKHAQAANDGSDLLELDRYGPAQTQPKALHCGGVGYYEREQFVHVDVGRVRRR